MLSPTSHRETTSTTPSQLRNAMAGLWSSVVTTSSVPNHGIPVPTNYEKLLDKHSAVLQEMKLSDNEIAEIIDRGFHRLQENLRERHAQTNATVQQLGIHMMRELHEDIRLEKAQAMVLQKRKVAVNAGADQKFRIAQELAEARIKARQALNLADSSSKDESDEEEEEETTPQTISPTSVAEAAFVQLTPQQKRTLKLDAEEDDDDIQELES